MNIQEREQLTVFLQQLAQANVAQKDGEAESLIRDTCMRQPDAAYLLVQRAMLLNQALQSSEAQLARLQAELDQLRGQVRTGAGSGNFLDANAWGTTSVPRAGSTPQGPSNASAPASAAPPGAAPQPSAWGSGMMGNIAATAAGVVAGGFLYQGISHLLGSHASSAGLTDNMNHNVANDHFDAAALDAPADYDGTRSGLFDTSSADDFVAGDGDSSS